MEIEELEIWTRLNELECVKKVFGKGYLPWRIGDDYCSPRSSSIIKVEDRYAVHHDAIWIPPLYDSIRPERSLLGIFLKNIRISVLNRYSDANEGEIKHMQIIELQKAITVIRPDLALAKAIIEQEATHDRE